MKANELMIGDFMLYNDDICIVDEIRVDNTTVLTALNTDVTSIDGDQVSVDEIMPIPLTEEILDKNFKDIAEPHQRIYGGRWVYFDNCFEVDIKIYKNGVCAITVEDCHLVPCWNMFARYIHELQHAFRLCGIKKEIIL